MKLEKYNPFRQYAAMEFFQAIKFQSKNKQEIKKMNRLLITIILSALALCGTAAAQAQSGKSDEQILRDLISRADKDPNAVKRSDDAIFVSGAFPRPIVGREQWNAMRSKRDGMTKTRINEMQKTELVRLVISESKDMAYDFGNFTVDYDTADKQHVTFNGSYLRVWRKIKGEWKSEAFFARPNEDPKTAAGAKTDSSAIMKAQ